MRKEILLSVGGYRKSMVDAEDYDLWLRVAEHCQLANLEHIVLKRRYHPYQISVSKRRQQMLSVLAAQASALSRRNGLLDPFHSVQEVTSVTLVGLGVSVAVQEATLAKIYLGRIRSMERAGEHSAALTMFNEIRSSSGWRRAERWVIADLQLFEARLYWRQARLVRSAIAAGHAIIKRPVLLGRPLKDLLRRLVSNRSRVSEYD
jgi:hypothetical protein